MQSGPALSRYEIGLNILMCIEFVHPNTFHFIFKKQNIRHSHHFETHMRRVRIHDRSNLIVYSMFTQSIGCGWWMAMLENESILHQQKKFCT